MHGELSKLDALYQRHAGQECYIFGDGISLKWMDLTQFADKPSILGNMMIYHKEARLLRVPYCAIIEPYFFYPYFPYHVAGRRRFIRHFIYKEYRKSILEKGDTLFFVNYSNYPVARFPNVLYVDQLYKPPFAIHNPFVERQDSHGGTLKFQISLAIFLGFKKAYLVGHDYTHASSKSLHFYEKGEGIPCENINFNQEFLNYAKQHMDLVTVTLGGGSETMSAITYRELTGNGPNFRENIDIVDRIKLENLATWKGYAIF